MTPNLAYAGRLERLFANLLDTLVLVVPALLFSAVGGPGSPLALVGTFLSNLIYYTAFTSSSWQATPGKRLLGIHVVQLNGMPMRQRDALERYLGYAMPSMPMYLSVGSENMLGMLTLYLSLIWYVPILLRDDRAGMHDLLCRTRVVVGKQ